MVLEREMKWGEGELCRAVAGLAAFICSDHFPTGDRAKLRRISPGQPLPLPFLHLAVSQLPAGWEAMAEDWAVLAAGIAIMAPHAHRAEIGLGKALAGERYSEARLERLLNAGGHTLRILFLRMARFMRAKGAGFNWCDAALLLLTREPSKMSSIRERIAMDYFTNIQEK